MDTAVFHLLSLCIIRVEVLSQDHIAFLALRTGCDLTLKIFDEETIVARLVAALVEIPQFWVWVSVNADTRPLLRGESLTSPMAEQWYIFFPFPSYAYIFHSARVLCSISMFFNFDSNESMSDVPCVLRRKGGK